MCGLTLSTQPPIVIVASGKAKEEYEQKPISALTTNSIVWKLPNAKSVLVMGGQQNMPWTSTATREIAPTVLYKSPV